jgi:hypothetical protein
MRSMKLFSNRKRLVVAAVSATAIAAGITGGLIGVGSASAGILPTTTTVVASANTIAEPGNITLVATVGPLDLAVTPTGTVTFTASGQGHTELLGISPTSSCLILVSTCTATLNTEIAGVPNGTYVITATYSGDLLSAGSSGFTTINVTGGGGGGGTTTTTTTTTTVPPTTTTTVPRTTTTTGPCTPEPPVICQG